MKKGVTHEQEVIQWARDEIQKRTGKTPEQLKAEREKRISDTINLKVPDRIPLVLEFSRFPLIYYKVPNSAAFYDPAAFQESMIKCLVEFETDAGGGHSQAITGIGLEDLGDQQFKWPGGPLRPDDSDQFLDMDIMKEDEYDLFITDIGDYLLRYYFPRAFSSLAPLAKLPPIVCMMRYSNLVSQSVNFITPEMTQAFKVLAKVGEEQAKYIKINNKFGNISDIVGTASLASGYSVLFKGGGAFNAGFPPFDLFANHLRGMRGTMVDMFRRPEKLIEACEKFLDWQLARLVPANPPGRRVRAGASHFMSEEFMSRKQYDKFVWPTWKRFLLALIDKGYIVRPFMEGKNDDRVENFLELPKGKALIGFEKIDIARAKSILGGHHCIDGGIPTSLLWGGSVSDVEEYTKNIIKTCGKDGGFIMSTTTGLDNAKPTNIKAVINTVNKYGRY